MKVAYFSMEFAVDDRLPIYAGGLGVLAGDHLKSASDLQVPLVAVGLLYRQGYFTQVIDETGRQQEEYPEADLSGVGLVKEDVTVEVDLAGETTPVDVWRLDVGSVPLYLLESEALVPRLYTIDQEERIRQEVVIGVAGVRALKALGHEPTVYHLNEGHAAFASLERIREEGLSACARPPSSPRTPRSRRKTKSSSRSSRGATSASWPRRRGSVWDFLEQDGGVGLTPLALKTAAYANGVSELHGEVSRGIARLRDRLDHNGAHVPTWKKDTPHAENKRSLIRYVRDRIGVELDPNRLTIGFTRRFATYKRATLLFQEPERLAELPVQVVVSGKAHPADDGGKELIAQITALAREPRFEGRIAFVPNYNMEVASYVTSGSDIWLNNPRRPMEASGTSGMKAAMNGVLNLSVLDGWWPEAYSRKIGWAIPGESDDADRAELFRLLEEEVIPTFYDDRERWERMMEASIERVTPAFSSHRMVKEYAERYYAPASR